MKRPQILVFTYHKSGTVLFAMIMRSVAERFGLSVEMNFGYVPRTNPEADIVLLPHSLIGSDFESRPFRAVRIVRDPRDLWVSGYLYHLRCNEDWCVSTDFDPAPPIDYPRVDYSFQHYPEAWKRDYLRRLEGLSYQQNLSQRDRDAGLAFELGGYTGCTLDALRGWWLRTRNLLDVKLEAINKDFDRTLLAIFRHLGFSEADALTAVELAAPHDLSRMSDATVEWNPHIYSRTLSKWREFLSPQQVAEFERQHGDVIAKLGYPLADGMI